MSSPTPPKPPVPDASLPLRLLRALGETASSHPSPGPDADLLGHLKEAERKIKETWPGAKPSGDGVDYLDRIMKILARRLRWKARIATAGEIVWLLGKVAGLVVCFGLAWQTFVA